MKILLLSVFLGVASILKIIHKKRFSEEEPSKILKEPEIEEVRFNSNSAYYSQNKNLVDVRDFYTIKYKKYKNISRNILVLTPQEQLILSALQNGIDNRYTIRIIGGWVRDKVK